MDFLDFNLTSNSSSRNNKYLDHNKSTNIICTCTYMFTHVTCKHGLLYKSHKPSIEQSNAYLLVNKGLHIKFHVERIKIHLNSHAKNKPLNFKILILTCLRVINSCILMINTKSKMNNFFYTIRCKERWQGREWLSLTHF